MSFDEEHELRFDEESHTYFVDSLPVPSVTEIVGILTADKYAAPNAALEGARARGSRVHELCMDLDLGELPEEFEAEALPYLNAYKSFLRDFKPKWLYMELPLFSESYAGTLDRIGYVDGAPRVVDIKTTSSMDRASKTALACQITAYEILSYKNGIDVYPDGGFGVQLKKDGTYTVYDTWRTEARYMFNSAALFGQLVEINRILKG